MVSGFGSVVVPIGWSLSHGSDNLECSAYWLAKSSDSNVYLDVSWYGQHSPRYACRYIRPNSNHLLEEYFETESVGAAVDWTQKKFAVLK